jgi:hypothetical protein
MGLSAWMKVSAVNAFVGSIDETNAEAAWYSETTARVGNMGWARWADLLPRLKSLPTLAVYPPRRGRVRRARVAPGYR